MRLLAFDTSTERLAIGVCTPAGRFAVDAAGGALASTTLLPQIRALLGRAGLGFDELDAIAFGHGPGAFTGLRTSCAVAQGLGFGLARPLLPIDSLLIVAEDARTLGDDGTGVFDVAVAMDARMDEVYAARYRHGGHGGRDPGGGAGHWQVLSAPALYALEALGAAWQAAPPARIAGSALAAFGGRLPAPPGAGRLAEGTDRALALLRLAEAAFEAGAAIDPAAALPLYLRDKVALTSEERARQRNEAARAAAMR